MTSYDLYLIEAHAIEKKNMLYDVRYQKGKEDNRGICRHNTTEKQKYTTAIHFYFITENEIGGSTEKKERKKTVAAVCHLAGNRRHLYEIYLQKKKVKPFLCNLIQNKSRYNCP